MPGPSRYRHFIHSAEATLGLLFALATLAALLLGWGVARLLAGAAGELSEQHGLHWIAEACMLMLNAPNPADRLLAYSLLTLLLLMLGRATSQAVRQLHSTRQLVHRLAGRQLPLSPDLQQLVAQVGLHGRVVLLEHDTPLAFCTGLFKGRVYITTAIVQMLGRDDALAAVLLHEGYHLRHHDPLLMLLARATGGAFFFLPIIATLYQHYLALRELAADRAAIVAQGRREPLAAALYRLASVAAPAPASVSIAHVLASGNAVLNARLDALLGVAEPYNFKLPHWRLLISGTMLGLTVAILTLTYAAHKGLVLMTIGHWLQGYC